MILQLFAQMSITGGKLPFERPGLGVAQSPAFAGFVGPLKRSGAAWWEIQGEKVAMWEEVG